MRYVFLIACGMVRRTPIPLFAERPSHPFVPLDDPSAVARRRGQGRPSAGACALPLTEASTMARWRRGGDRACSRFALLLLASATALGMPAVAVHAQAAPIALQASGDPYAASRCRSRAAPLRHSSGMDSGDHADREPWRSACRLTQGRDGPDADHAPDLGRVARALRPRPQSLRSSRQHPGGRGLPA